MKELCEVWVSLSAKFVCSKTSTQVAKKRMSKPMSHYICELSNLLSGTLHCWAKTTEAHAFSILYLCFCVSVVYTVSWTGLIPRRDQGGLKELCWACGLRACHTRSTLLVDSRIWSNVGVLKLIGWTHTCPCNPLQHVDFRQSKEQEMLQSVTVRPPKYGLRCLQAHWTSKVHFA